MSFDGATTSFLRRTSSHEGGNGQNATAMHASTEQAHELEALERAQQAYERSIMALVHELRSPVAVSKSMVATARFLNAQDAQLDNFLVRIENRMDQLLQLVDDMLDLSQAKAGRLLGRDAILDLVVETRNVCAPYLEEAAARGLTMHVELPEATVRARVAQKDYQLVLSNLVSNAVKYTPTGAVRVSLREEGGWAVLVVQDTGIGIPRDEIRHLFTEFFRASNARARRTPGTGLGLALAHALVAGCNGELAVQSEENEGSQFTVWLPLCQWVEDHRDERDRVAGGQAATQVIREKIRT